MSARSFRRSRAKRIAREQRRLAKTKRRVLIAGATLGATAAFAANAEAATYTVNSTADNGSGTCGSTCTLRDAVNTANTNGVAGTPDTIDFAPNVTGTITLTQGQITISDPGGLNIDGPGASTLSVSGGGTSGIFSMSAPTGNPEVSISGLTLTGGSSSSPGAAIDDETAPLTLSADTITGNTSMSLGGGIFVNNQGTASLSVSGSTISDNTAYDGGGVFGFGPVTISNSQITGNGTSINGGGFAGGGIEALGGLTLTGSTVSGNSATVQGGGIDTKYQMTIEDSTISQNTAPNGGGVHIDTSSPGTSPVLVENSTVSGNQGAKGAGLEVAGTNSNSPVTIQASTISGNQGGANSFGGGVLITGELYSPFDLVDSTISGNTATNGGGVSLSYGGSTTKVLGTGGSIAFDNSTIDGNTADTNGGGIYLGEYSAGSPATKQSATADINSTIVANDTSSGTENDLYRPTSSTSGGFNDTFSLIQNPGNAPLLSSQALITGVDPQLGPLANNGGPTQTMLPKDTSPVIDQGKAKSGLTTDQRGDPRTVDNGKPKPPGGDGTDIGAVELAKIPAPTPPPPTSPSISDTVGPASGITLTGATLHGIINTSGEAVTWHFEYGQSTAYGKVTPSQSISTGQGNVPVSFQVSGLKPGTRYHYRVVAVSAAGQTAVSTDASFKTPAPTLKIKPRAVRAAHAVRFFGTAACTRGSRVTLISGAFSSAHKFRGRNAIYARIGAGGKYFVVTRIPAGRNPGRYAVTGRCDGVAFGVTAHLRILPAPPVARFTA